MKDKTRNNCTLIYEYKNNLVRIIAVSFYVDVSRINRERFIL